MTEQSHVPEWRWPVKQMETQLPPPGNGPRSVSEEWRGIARETFGLANRWFDSTVRCANATRRERMLRGRMEKLSILATGSSGGANRFD